MLTPTIGRFVTMRAQPGRGDELATSMLKVAHGLVGAPGCALYAIGRDKNDADVIRVTELWSDEESIAAALTAEAPEEVSVDDVLSLLAGRPEVIEFTPLGGAGIPQS